MCLSKWPCVYLLILQSLFKLSRVDMNCIEKSREIELIAKLLWMILIDSSGNSSRSKSAHKITLSIGLGNGFVLGSILCNGLQYQKIYISLQANRKKILNFYLTHKSIFQRTLWSVSNRPPFCWQESQTCSQYQSAFGTSRRTSGCSNSNRHA